MPSGFLGGGIGPVALKRRRAAAGNGLLNNLVAYWPLSEAGGANNAIDLHTNALHLTQNSSPGSDTGKVYAGARTFNGSTRYFSRASEAALSLGNVDYTIAAWVFLSVKISGFIACKGNALDGADWDYAISYLDSADRMRLSIGNGTGLSSVLAENYGAPDVNTWMLIIAQHDAASKAIYISVDNGTLNSASYMGIHDTTTKIFAIGALSDYSDNRWNGRIGPVAMWKSAPGGGGVLTAAQRAALWNGGAGLAYAEFTA